MNYNKYINSFADSNEYNSYIESDKAYSPNIGFIEETKQVKWIENVMKDCIFYGTTKGNTDFMIGSSVSDGDSDCIKVHIILQTDGSDNIMYATKTDIVKTPVIISIDAEITSIKKWNIDTSSVTDMNYMFGDCDALTSLDLSTFDTSKVTDMNYMFGYCSALTSLDVSSFNTSNVTDMRRMFGYCESLASLDLSSFNTSNVTNMYYMFGECHSLTSLDLSSFNTSNVTDMYSMFFYCESLASLDVSTFDTSNVTDMGGMFGNCTALTSLDLSSFNTSSVTDMNYMFGKCSALTSLDVSSFNTSNVTDMGGMFDDCSALTSLTLSSSFFNSSAVTEFDLSGLTSWTEATSLSQFVNAISSKDGTGKTVKLSNATKTALTDAQKNSITSKGWTIA